MASAAPAQGQGAYPAKPIRFIVPFAPSGVSDIVARAIAAKMSESMGQQVLIENRGGAGGTLGIDLLAKAPADGYTIATGNISTQAIAASVYRKLPYDPLKDFAPVSLVATTTNVLGASMKLPVASVRELIAYGKSKPDSLSFASSGVGTIFHIAGEMMATMADLHMVHIPYKGVALAYPDVIGGTVPLIFDSIVSASGQVKGGRIRALAVTGARRSPVLPDVPTMAEAGLPGYELDFWIAIFAPAGTPAPVVQRLNAEINRALKQPDLVERMAGQGADVVGTTPEALMARVQSEIPRMAKIVKAARIEPE
jgi:tripartite-type tricarboxylate transporter receptor subunit TctC